MFMFVNLQQDVAEWLHLLNLDTYFECITTQGYGQIDDVTEITWEDLEEIGIKKLGERTGRMGWINEV